LPDFCSFCIFSYSNHDSILMTLKSRLIDSVADFAPAELGFSGFIEMQQVALAELGTHPSETKPASPKKARAKS